MNCTGARAGLLRSRTQSSVALSGDGENWFLVNASPDLRAQMDAFPGLHPSSQSTRNSPLAAVLLTNADLDHVLGLFLLREGGQLRIHCPESIFQILQADLRLTDILQPMCSVAWTDAPSSLAPLVTKAGEPSGLRYRAIALATKPPPYARSLSSTGAQSVAYEIVDERTQARLVIAPDVAVITPELQLALNSADAVLFDGTFWSNEEFQVATGKSRTANDMGHLPIRDGSLEALRSLKARHKIYLHINNTNPILNPDSPEYAEVQGAGITVGRDGMEFEL